MKYTVGVRDGEVYKVGTYNEKFFEQGEDIVEIPIDFKRAKSPCDNNWGEIKLHLQNIMGYKFKTFLTEETTKN